MSSGGFTLFLEKDIMMKKRLLLGFAIGMLNINGLSAAGGPAEESNFVPASAQPLAQLIAQLAAQAAAQAAAQVVAQPSPQVLHYPAVPDFSAQIGGTAMFREPSALQVEMNAKFARIVALSKAKRKKEVSSRHARMNNQIFGRRLDFGSEENSTEDTTESMDFSPLDESCRGDSKPFDGGPSSGGLGGGGSDLCV